MTVSVAINHLRKSKNLKQGDFAKRIGITQSYLSSIENGKKTPTVGLLQKIADEFGVPTPIMFWFTIDESDVSEEKKEAYRILKPTIDEMIKTIWE